MLTDKESPVHAAVRGNQREILREFLQRDANINSSNTRGDTPLTLAVAVGNEWILNDLLSAGSNPARHSRFVYP